MNAVEEDQNGMIGESKFQGEHCWVGVGKRVLEQRSDIRSGKEIRIIGLCQVKDTLQQGRTRDVGSCLERQINISGSRASRTGCCFSIC